MAGGERRDEEEEKREKAEIDREREGEKERERDKLDAKRIEANRKGDNIDGRQDVEVGKLMTAWYTIRA